MTASSPDLARAAQGQNAKAQLVARMKGKKPVATHVDFVDNDDVNAAYIDAKAAYDRADILHFGEADSKKETDKAWVAARDALRVAEMAHAEATTRMHFRGLPRDEFEQMILDHPPTAEQVAEANDSNSEKPTYNVDTFPQALVAASTWLPPTDEEKEAAKAAGHPEPEGVQPLFTIEELADATEKWNQAEWEKLWNAALFVNRASRNASIPKG